MQQTYLCTYIYIYLMNDDDQVRVNLRASHVKPYTPLFSLSFSAERIARFRYQHRSICWSKSYIRIMAITRMAQWVHRCIITALDTEALDISVISVFRIVAYALLACLPFPYSSPPLRPSLSLSFVHSLFVYRSRTKRRRRSFDWKDASSSKMRESRVCNR